MTPAFAFSIEEAQLLARMRQFEFSRSPIPPSVHRVRVRVSYELKAFGQTPEAALGTLRRCGLVWSAPDMVDHLKDHKACVIDSAPQKSMRGQQYTFLFEWVFERHICAPNPKEAKMLARNIDTLPQTSLGADIDTEWLGYL